MAFIFFGISSSQSQTISGYKFGDKALIKFLEKELNSLDDEIYKRNTLIYTEVYFNLKGILRRLAFLVVMAIVI
ncbi:MAG: hypothetical protein WKF85_11950 [Chitinophagaceae bacterium]